MYQILSIFFFLFLFSLFIINNIILRFEYFFFLLIFFFYFWRKLPFCCLLGYCVNFVCCCRCCCNIFELCKVCLVRLRSPHLKEHRVNSTWVSLFFFSFFALLLLFSHQIQVQQVSSCCFIVFQILFRHNICNILSRFLFYFFFFYWKYEEEIIILKRFLQRQLLKSEYEKTSAFLSSKYTSF